MNPESKKYGLASNANNENLVVCFCVEETQ